MIPFDKHKEAARKLLNIAHRKDYEVGVLAIAQDRANLEAATEARVRRECAEIARKAADILASGDTTDAK